MVAINWLAQQGHAPTETERSQPDLFGLQKGWCPSERGTPRGHLRAGAGDRRHVARGIFGPGGVEIAEWGWENSADYIVAGRTVGEPWWHELLDPPIPGPPMIVVSKATGAVRTFIGASVPDYYRENNEEELAIGDVPDDE